MPQDTPSTPDAAAGTDAAADRPQEPQTAEERTRQFFGDLREKAAAGESIFTPADEDATADDADQGGDDAAKEPAEATGEEAAAEEAGAAEDGTDGAGGGEEGDETEDGDAADAGADPEAGGGDDEPLVVKLRGRRPGEEIELEVGDKATADEIRRLDREGLRAEELKAEKARLQEQWDEIEEIDVAMATDPAGFLLGKVTDDYRVTVAKALLLDPKVFAAVEEELQVMAGGDDDAAELARRRNADERKTKADAARTQVQAARSAKAKVREIGGHIAGLVPDGMDDGKASRFQKAALHVAEELAHRRKTLDLSRDELVAELKKEGLLDRFGIEPGAAPARRKGRAASTPRGSESAADDQPTDDDAVRTPEGLKKARLRRKAVAGSASSGAGAPPASVELPSHGNVKDRISYVRKHGLGSVMQGK